MRTIEQKSTKKQHYVPQFYLRQWTDDEESFYPIRIEQKVPPKLKIFSKKSGPSRFCYENFFYAQHTGKEDKASQIIEKQFGQIESIFSTKIFEIEKKILNNEKITENDKYHLCECMLFLYFRGKKYREQSQRMDEYMVKEINKHLAYCVDKDQKMKMDELGITKEQLIDFTERGEYSVDFGNMQHLLIMKDIHGFCNLLSAKYWKVYITQDSDFITTDTPYQDIPTSREFWGNDFLSREQRFILSPCVAIIAVCPKYTDGKKFHRKDITNNKIAIHRINSEILMNSISFGFHKEKKVLQSVEEVVYARYKELEFQRRINFK